MKFKIQPLILIKYTIVILLLLNSCSSKKEQVNAILNLEIANSSVLSIEKIGLNQSLETPQWIVLKITNTLELKNKILSQLNERNEIETDKNLCIEKPYFYNSKNGFWYFNETELTKLKQLKILNSIKGQKFKEYGGYYNTKKKCFVKCTEKWDGRSVVYVTNENIFILILKITS